MDRLPFFARKAIKLLFSSKISEELEWDLFELYKQRLQEGQLYATMHLAKDILFSMRNIDLKRKTFYQYQNSKLMFLLKLAYRGILKNRKLTLINVLGLVIGIVSFLILDDYAHFHKSFDKIHGDDTYRVRLTHFYDGSEEPEASSYAAIGKAMKADFPEVKEYVTLVRKSLSKGTFSIEKNGITSHFFEEKVFFASEGFFDVFAFELLEGDKESCLNRPDAAVISSSIAAKYFGEEDPIGKTITRNGSEDYEVTGVFEDFPENSHLKTDILLSFKTFERIRPDVIDEHAWVWWMFYTYIKTDSNTSQEQIEDKFSGFIQKYIGEDGEDEVNFYLQPIKSIHLNSHFASEAEVNVRKENVDVLLIMGYFILILSLINYINLASSRSLERSKEVGVKKVLGSNRLALIQQFLTESLITGILAFVIGIVLLLILRKPIESITGSPLILWGSQLFWIKSLFIILLVCMGAGLYPAFVLSSFRPLIVLRGKFINSSSGTALRRSLVLAQFIVTFGIISATLIVTSQLKFMTNQNINADIQKVLYSKAPTNGVTDIQQEIEVLKQELLKDPNISAITITSSVPGKETWGAGGVRRMGASQEEAVQLQGLDIDDDFHEVFGVDLLHGRFYDQHRPNENQKLMLSEKASNLLGYQSPLAAVGQNLRLWGDTLEIIGIVDNYHHLSLKTDLEPLFFMLTSDYEYVAYRLNAEDLNAGIDAIEQKWDQIFPGNPIELRFVDEDYQKLYNEEIRLQQTVSVFSVISIFIAILGIYGLSSFNLLRKMKEISVRKVLGASPESLTILLSREYFLTILLASIISIPIIYYFFNSWIDSFAYQINFKVEFILIPLLSVLLVIAFTIGAQIYRATQVNPAESLSNE